MSIDVAALTAASGTELATIIARLHEAGPVHRARYHDVDMWLVTGHDEARRLLTDARRFSNRESYANPAAQASPMLVHQDVASLPPMLPFLDPPAHTRLRRLVNKVFTPARVERLRPSVQEVADELLDAMAVREECDLVRDFAFPLPVSVIMRLVGVPSERGEDFHRWAGLFATGDPEKMPLVPAAMAEMLTFAGSLVRQRRDHPEDDLLSAMVAVSDGGATMAPEEAAAMVFALVAAGHETTLNLIGNGMLTLLDNPAMLAGLRSDLSRVDAAVEELLRVDAPAKMTAFRYVVEDVELAGTPMRAGDVVAVLLAAANQDPRRFSGGACPRMAPEPGNPHLAFGAGVHFCVGAPLARLEAQIAFRGLLGRFTDFEITVPRDELRWKASLFVRGPVSLPMRYRRAGGQEAVK
jgi:6-deoxyerythronolide B hydroxylase